MAVDWTRHGRRLAKIAYAEFSSLLRSRAYDDLRSAHPNAASACGRRV